MPPLNELADPPRNERMMRQSTKAVVLRTFGLVAAMLAVYAVLFVGQFLLRIGPVGATVRASPGSPEWFRAASQWAWIDTFWVWPLLIIAAAAVQRYLCRRSSILWVMVFVVVAMAIRHPNQVVRSAIMLMAYGACAIVTALIVQAVLNRGDRIREAVSSP